MWSISAVWQGVTEWSVTIDGGLPSLAAIVADHFVVTPAWVTETWYDDAQRASSGQKTYFSHGP
jgi:hypothetical protein